MNLFVLDHCVKESAKQHTDSHVRKIILESAQVASTALITWWVVRDPRLYKPTHVHHPVCVWAGLSPANILWTVRYGLALCDEFHYRWGKRHKTEAVLRLCGIHAVKLSLEWQRPPTPHAQAMPAEYKSKGDPIHAYRSYFRGEKQHLKQYTKRKEPTWWLY